VGSVDCDFGRHYVRLPLTFDPRRGCRCSTGLAFQALRLFHSFHTQIGIAIGFFGIPADIFLSV
jgi:hypothetical protein